jgi:hypothetical protein
VPDPIEASAPVTPLSEPDRHRGPQGHARPVAAGGWRRAVLGLAVGALAGVVVTTVLPAEDARSSGRLSRGRVEGPW